MRRYQNSPTRPVRVIFCPNCDSVPMLLAMVRPLLPSASAEELHYACNACGARDIEIIRHRNYIHRLREPTGKK